MTRLAFLGSSRESATCLSALIGAGHEIVSVVTAPDKRRGRGSQASPTLVKTLASERGLPVVHELADLGHADADLAVVVAFGRIIPESLLREREFLNVHFSLLPRWRGAAPVERAILAGDEVTGVSLIRLVKELDAGPVYASSSTTIQDRESAESLRSRLAEMGASLLVERLSDWPASLGAAKPQDPSVEPTYAKKIDVADLELDWARPAVELERQVRVGRAWTLWRGRRLIVWDAVAEVSDQARGSAAGQGPPGSIRGTRVVTGSGSLGLLQVQEEGRPRRAAEEWLRGARPGADEVLG